MMLRTTLYLTILLLCFEAKAVHAHFALVIGNNQYPEEVGKLKRATRSAEEMSEHLSGLGYKMITQIPKGASDAKLSASYTCPKTTKDKQTKTQANYHQDLTGEQIVKLVRATYFCAQKAVNGELAVIYFAGHGLRQSNVDYILGVDKVRVEVAEIQKLFKSSATGVILIDACRNTVNERLLSGLSSLKIPSVSSPLPRPPEWRGYVTIYAVDRDEKAKDHLKFVEWFRDQFKGNVCSRYRDLPRYITQAWIDGAGSESSPAYMENGLGDVDLYIHARPRDTQLCKGSSLITATPKVTPLVSDRWSTARTGLFWGGSALLLGGTGGAFLNSDIRESARRTYEVSGSNDDYLHYKSTQEITTLSLTSLGVGAALMLISTFL